MLKKTKKLDGEITSPTLPDRLLMAMIAPIVFNVSIVIVLALAFRNGSFLTKLLFAQTEWLVLALILFPAIAGFIMGSRKFAMLLGHFFYSNMEHEKSMAKTLVCWFSLGAVVYCLSRLL